MDCSTLGSFFLIISLSLLRFMSIESIMPSNHLTLCCPLLHLPSIFPNIRVFSNELDLRMGGQSTGASASASILLVNIQGWFPLGLTGHIHTTIYKEITRGICLAVQWLRLYASNSGGTGSISGWGTKIPHAVGCFQKKNRQLIRTYWKAQGTLLSPL